MNGWGGKRPGAGRKPKLSTIIRAQRIEEANGEADWAFGFFVACMHDEDLPLPFRKECAVEVYDRVRGKATQTNKNEQSGELIIRVEHVKQDRTATTPRTAPESTAGEG